MLTYAAFGLILLIIAQPFAVIRLIRDGEIAMKGTRFTKYSEPKRFWTVIGITIAWLVVTDALLITALYQHAT